MPVLELSPLFEAAQYKASGNLFWADYHVGDSAWPVSSLYSLFQLPAPWEGGGAQRLRQTESGQLLLDRCDPRGKREGRAGRLWLGTRQGGRHSAGDGICVQCWLLVLRCCP